MVAPATPSKPAALPPAAAWSDELAGWEVCARDPGGQRQGECLVYREDGTLSYRYEYVAGRLSGAFAGYHPNGELAERGSFVDGQLDGDLVKYTSERDGSAPLRSCCVPSGARELRVRYRSGRFLGEAFYDARGVPIDANGLPWPDRPAAVPEGAYFDGESRLWSVTAFEADSDVERVRTFGVDGRPLEAIDYRSGRRARLARLDPDGVPSEELHFDGEDRLHGAYLRRHAHGEGPYADARIASVRGAFDHGVACGVWRYLDAAGAEVRAVERSDAVRESLVSAARAAARSGELGELTALLARSRVELRPELALERGEALVAAGSATAATALAALLDGADAALAIRALASVAPGASNEALELVEAARLLAPARRMTHLTRALIRLERGDREGALADAGQIEPESRTAADFLRDFARVHFPAFTFAPALGAPPEGLELLPVEIQQPIAAIRRAAGVYATRLGLLRNAVKRAVAELGEPAWLPPDLSALLPDGQLELRKCNATITDETDDGTETCEVEIDERLSLPEPSDSADRGAGVSIPSLMAIARADFAALSWLCWAVGLDRVELPARVNQRPEFVQAVHQATERCFRAHDRVRTGGLVALARKLPGFQWEGSEIDALHPRLAEVAAREYLEIRAMFFWLVFAENLSPFQNDLRQV